jgi:hypothetical protein
VNLPPSAKLPRQEKLRPPHFFIVGCPGSGTTLLRALLDSHPHVSVAPEFFVVPWVVAKFGYGPYHPATLRKIARNYRKIIPLQPYTHTYLLNLSGVEEYARRTNQSLSLHQLYALLLARWSQSSPFWGAKAIAYNFFLDVVSKVFPQTRFIHLIRDARATAASCHRRWKTPLTVHAFIWRAVMDTFHRFKTNFPKVRLLEIRYEKLVQAPRSTLKEICAFLQIPYDNRMLTFDPRKLPVGFPLFSPLSSKRVEAWKRELSPAMQQKILAITAPCLRKMGYLQSPAPNFPFLAPLALAAKLVHLYSKLPLPSRVFIRHAWGIAEKKIQRCLGRKSKRKSD